MRKIIKLCNNYDYFPSFTIFRCFLIASPETHFARHLILQDRIHPPGVQKLT